MVGGSDGYWVQRNDVMGRLEVVLEPVLFWFKVGFDQMKWDQGLERCVGTMCLG